MNCKQSLLGAGKFYIAEEALTLLRNMSDFEDESTSESELKVILLTLLNTHLNNNIRSEPIQIFKHYYQKKQLIRMPQNVHYWLMKQPPHQVRNMLLHPQKYLKSKKYPQRAKKLHQNWLLIRMPQNVHYWLMKQPSDQVRNMSLHPQKYLKSKKYPQRAKKLHQNWLLIRMPQNVHYWLMKQPSDQVRNMSLHPQKYLKSKKYLQMVKSCTKTGC